DLVQHRNEVGRRCWRRVKVTARYERIVGGRADDMRMSFPRSRRDLQLLRSRSRTRRQTVANNAIEVKHRYGTFYSKMKSTPALVATVLTSLRNASLRGI